MSLEELHATQQAAHDALVAAGVETGARVRLARRSAKHTASLSMGTRARTTDEEPVRIARVRFDRVRRNQWRTLIERDLAELEVMVEGRYVPFVLPAEFCGEEGENDGEG